MRVPSGRVYGLDMLSSKASKQASKQASKRQRTSVAKRRQCKKQRKGQITHHTGSKRRKASKTRKIKEHRKNRERGCVQTAHLEGRKANFSCWANLLSPSRPPLFSFMRAPSLSLSLSRIGW